MLVALYENERRVNMYDDWRMDMHGHSFYCPVCGSEVIACRGNERRYFRHKSLNSCPYNEYEHEQDNRSIAHETMKRYLHDGIVGDEYDKIGKADFDFKCEYEKYISNGHVSIIPDVYVEYNLDGKKKRFGFEIQKSRKSEEKILEKNEKYKELGVRYTWIGSKQANLSKLATVSGHKIIHRWYEEHDGDEMHVKGFYLFDDSKDDQYWIDTMKWLDCCNDMFERRHKKLIWFELTNKCCRENMLELGTKCELFMFSSGEEPFVLW